MMMMMIIIPVSYTHLDVYKRQLIMSASHTTDMERPLYIQSRRLTVTEVVIKLCACKRAEKVDLRTTISPCCTCHDNVNSSVKFVTEQ